MRPVLVPLMFGAVGAAVLVALGVWQLQRLAWKQGVLAEIEARITAPPVAVPLRPDPRADRYLPVTMTGTFGAGVLRVLVSQKHVGAGYRLISPFETGGRSVLLDRGFLRVDQAVPQPPPGQVTVIGNLHWPDDRTAATPDNDIPGNTWFARDIGLMAAILETEPVLVIARSLSHPDAPVTPLPVDTRGIPNDHLEYAVTWFGLALIWGGLTLYFLWCRRKPAKEAAP